MFKRILCIWLCLTLMLCSVPALAAMKAGKNVQLVVCGDLVTLNTDTGYICKDGSKTYIPIAAVADALGYDVAFNAKKTGVAITIADKHVVKAVKGYRKITVNGKSFKLKNRAVMHNGVLMVDYQILKYLKADVELYPYTANLKLLGYSGPTMVINHEGQSTTAPALTKDSFAANLEAAKTADQIIAVQYSKDSSATLTFHEKIDGTWRQQLSCSAIVGKNGIGKTVEGDKKTPRGTYDLTMAFGIEENPGTALPYTRLTKDHYWCCTSDSEYYNQLVDVSQTEFAPAKSDEHLKAMKGYYDYAVVLNYNPDNVPGKGSAIFLHCTGEKTSTNGCIAIAEDTLIQILQMLKPGAKIVIL